MSENSSQLAYEDCLDSGFITLANKVFLAHKVRPFLGYIRVTEFENEVSFVQLALVFKIFDNSGKSRF